MARRGWNGWLWLEMAGNNCKIYDMAGTGWNWLKIARKAGKGYRWLRMTNTAENGC